MMGLAEDSLSESPMVCSAEASKTSGAGVNIAKKKFVTIPSNWKLLPLSSNQTESILQQANTSIKNVALNIGTKGKSTEMFLRKLSLTVAFLLTDSQNGIPAHISKSSPRPNSMKPLCNFTLASKSYSGNMKEKKMKLQTSGKNYF